MARYHRLIAPATTAVARRRPTSHPSPTKMPGRPYAKTLAGVPVLIAEPRPSPNALPVVLWYHGFNADALAHAAELQRCADAGFLAVGIDAVGHGARLDPSLDARVAAANNAAIHIMLDVVEDTLAEQPMLIESLADAFPIDHTRGSLVSISIGAVSTQTSGLLTPAESWSEAMRETVNWLQHHG